jgi:Uncharacterised nucleotidyltransferase
MASSFQVQEEVEESVWSRVDRLVDRFRTVEQLYLHGLHLLAARRWRALGRPVPEELVASEGAARTAIDDALHVLERVRAAVSGRIVLVHGLEVAASYPDRALRSFGDLDLLVENEPATRAALLRAGFEEIEADGPPPLVWPERPVPLELFNRPRWVDGHPAPDAAELLSRAQPSSTGVEGVDALPPVEHALVVAANAWAHKPLRRARDLVDVAALTATLERAELDAAARAWRMERLWSTTIGAADGLLSGRPTLPLRLWARDVWELREQSFRERLLRHYLAVFWALPAPPAARATVRTILRDARRISRP